MEEPSNSDRQCCRLESWVSDINRRPISPLFSLFQLLNNTFSPFYLQHQGTFLQDLHHIHLLLEVITRLHRQLIHHHRDRCMGSYQPKRFQMLHQVSVPWYSSKSMGDSQETIGKRNQVVVKHCYLHFSRWCLHDGPASPVPRDGPKSATPASLSASCADGGWVPNASRWCISASKWGIPSKWSISSTSAGLWIPAAEWIPATTNARGW